MGNELRTDALPAMRKRDGDRVNPAAMAVVSRHDGSNDFFVGDGDKEQVIIDCDFFIDHEVWAIVGGFVGENCLPQDDDLAALQLVIVMRNCNIHLGETSNRSGQEYDGSRHRWRADFFGAETNGIRRDTKRNLL